MLKEYRVLKVLGDLMVYLLGKELKELKEIKVHKVHKDFLVNMLGKDYREPVVLMDILGLMDHRVLKEHKDYRDCKDLVVFKEH